MKINLKVRHVSIKKGLAEYIRRRMAFALASRDDQTDQINVTLSDINGPRGGKDKRCQVRIVIAGQRDIVIDDVQQNWQEAIDSAASRASRTLTRRLARIRSKSIRPKNRLPNGSLVGRETEYDQYLSAAGEH
ncbi:HPF/RaiA family ribosome-associated protein [Amphritea pacifica]|uniref:HPF/RaiA family ribosome-associated protein n=1 Tax=Amphritea pacifica TaxID=2811233 RepID=A0ABS2W2C1_9GAMM|nr:HPF/RaiA family ribosome-associated protein [Amphritea pacifica]MBN0985853.1 HPF/RaiA family ribosome-associated protein [Amphritea pacifica]MBN1005934.1 HPF/RaiA family ribosome-associated protein [Amphritea pacifica]